MLVRPVCLFISSRNPSGHTVSLFGFTAAGPVSNTGSMNIALALGLLRCFIFARWNGRIPFLLISMIRPLNAFAVCAPFPFFFA
ncbi:hypothetical protein K438DRAFT_1831108 [Mycena galopus ATCC 62051]|nr:hypothetical protein K438DRAFT_1831108 [Mycena galopus ATCC 62051]